MGSSGKSFALLLVAIFLISTVTFHPALVKAQTRTITVPDDYPTIQGAINQANAGDAVYVKRGIYDETLVINKPISLIVEDENSTIINAQQVHAQVILIEASNVLVANFTLGNSGMEPYSDTYIQENGEGDGIRVTESANVTIRNTAIFALVDGIDMSDSDYDYVVGNIFWGAALATAPTNSAIGILLNSNSTDSVIANNTFTYVIYDIFSSYYGQVVPNNNNNIAGNRNLIIKTSIPKPFPSNSPSSSPNPIPTATSNPTLSTSPNIPAFPTWMILPLFAVIILLSTVFIRKKLPKKS